MNIEKLRIQLQEKIDEFEIRNSSVADTLYDCEPYKCLHYVKTKEELNEYIDDYISNIDETKQWLEDFSEMLDDFRNNI